MEKLEFERIARPGDLVFIVVNTNKGEINLRRQFRIGIYERNQDPNYGNLRHIGLHFESNKVDTRHGFDFSPFPNGVKFSTIANVQVAIGREQIAQQIGQYLGSEAESDYRSRWERVF